MRPLIPILLVISATPAAAQDGAFVVTLGKDTVAVEKFTRTATKMTGEMASRLGVNGNRLSYEVTIGADGKPTSVVYRARPMAGIPPVTPPREIRLTFLGDSVKREAIFADSTSTRMLPAAQGMPFVYPAYGLMEVTYAHLRKTKATGGSYAMVGTFNGNPGSAVLTVGQGDVINASGGGLITVYHVDPSGKVLSVDASGTTQKLMTTRLAKVDFDGIASRMQPLGVLSVRGTATGSIQQSVVFVSYGRPQVRGRTVWGGLLVPADTIWRLGANEATHIAVSRELTFGSVVVPPGIYTLWFFNASNGPQLVINRQVGQWGTSYDPAQDLGRVPVTMAATPEHVEDFTISFRTLAPRQGAIDFAWADKVATATFTVK